MLCSNQYWAPLLVLLFSCFGTFHSPAEAILVRNSNKTSNSCATLHCAIQNVQPVRNNQKRHLHKSFHHHDYSLVDENSAVYLSKWDRFLNKLIRKKTRKCLRKGNKGFHCEKLKWARWLKSQMDKNVTQLSDYMELVVDPSAENTVTSVQPENWPEKLVYKIVQRWGDAIDHLLFYKYKKFANTRELKVQVPSLFQVKLAPNRHEVALGRSGRTFWDPGFNLKLKLPFFHDELSKLSFHF